MRYNHAFCSHASYYVIYHVMHYMMYSAMMWMMYHRTLGIIHHRKNGIAHGGEYREYSHCMKWCIILSIAVRMQHHKVNYAISHNHSSIHWFMRSLIHWFGSQFVRSLIHSCIRKLSARSPTVEETKCININSNGHFTNCNDIQLSYHFLQMSKMFTFYYYTLFSNPVKLWINQMKNKKMYLKFQHINFN